MIEMRRSLSVEERVCRRIKGNSWNGARTSYVTSLEVCSAVTKTY